jgi:hypothetical protein
LVRPDGIQFFWLHLPGVDLHVFAPSSIAGGTIHSIGRFRRQLTCSATSSEDGWGASSRAWQTAVLEAHGHTRVWSWTKKKGAAGEGNTT